MCRVHCCYEMKRNKNMGVWKQKPVRPVLVNSSVNCLVHGRGVRSAGKTLDEHKLGVKLRLTVRPSTRDISVACGIVGIVASHPQVALEVRS